jgi:NAD(P)H-hydrate epimerase
MMGMRSLALLSLLQPARCLLTRRAPIYPFSVLSYYTYWSASGSIKPVFGSGILGDIDPSPDSSGKCSRRTMTSTSTDTSGVTGYLNAADAAALDVELMSSPGFSLEQLMELAGLACAEAVYQVAQERRSLSSSTEPPQILLVCGPGNNGGDGLVAARHLVMFGYNCDIVYPKQSSKQHFINLVQQCIDVGISVSTEMPVSFGSGESPYAVVVDAIFGFSFKGEAREPFATILKQIKEEAAANKNLMTISVDVPSGWNVDEGDTAKTGFVPDVLISLTTPKHCAKEFPGRHFVGGRFLPPKLAEKYRVRVSAVFPSAPLSRSCLIYLKSWFLFALFCVHADATLPRG